MHLFAAQGQRSLALAQFDRLTESLRRDLDTTPDPSTADLATTIRTGQFPTTANESRSRGVEESRSTDRSLLDSSTFSTPRLVRPLRLSASPPLPLNKLIGRDDAVAQIREILSTARLVTLTGPGGTGKTRLALAVAHTIRDDFPDGVAFVDLAPLRDPSLVPSVIAQTLGVREPAGQSVLAALAAALRDRHFLLILDNFEQVTDAVPAVRTLLEQSPQLTVLATSRIPLHLTGEHEYPVPPLSLSGEEGGRRTGGEERKTTLPHSPSPSLPLESDAVALFVERARAVQPAFELTEANAAAVAEICNRLDGLPLAIELAAARSKVLTPDAIVARLDRSLSLLVGGARDLPERQQTIRKTIVWSYDLLTPDEQTLFARLAVFAGGWTLDAAEAVAGGQESGVRGQDDVSALTPDSRLLTPDADVLDGLSSLVDKSLVLQREQAGEIRFGMLETIREFGFEQLAAAADVAVVRDRHAAYFVALAEEAQPHLEGIDQAAWLDRIAREEGNLRAALDWIHERDTAELGLRLVTALRMYWVIRGRIAEGSSRTLAIAALPGSLAIPGLRAEALNGFAHMAREGDQALAQRVSEESRAIARAAGDRKREADALANLAYLALRRGDLAEADTFSEAFLAINRDLGNQQGVADALSVLALTAQERDDLDTARRLHEECSAIWASLDDGQGVVGVRTRLADVFLRQGEHQRAFDEYLNTLAISRTLNYQLGLTWTFDGLAQLALARDAPVLALKFATAAARVRDAAGIHLSLPDQFRVDTLHAAATSLLAPDTVAPHESPIDDLIASLRDHL